MSKKFAEMREMISSLNNSTLRLIKQLDKKLDGSNHPLQKTYSDKPLFTEEDIDSIYEHQGNQFLINTALIAGFAIVTIGAAYLIKRQFFSKPDLSYRAIALTPEQAMEKMIRNSEKALKEHQSSHAVPSKEALMQMESTPLTLNPTFADDIGPRPTMEDAHLFMEIEQGTLAGVFDGHGGKEVSAYASEQFQNRFSAVLKTHNGDAFRAFEVLIHEIQLEVAKKPQWNGIGSTAVVSFIDKETHQIITATLGDSEANLYRSKESIALSVVRDWTCKKEALRLINAFGTIAQLWINKFGSNPKNIRSHLQYGVNVSRAIGDVSETGTKEKPLVIHKPKITINKLQKGDILVLACDGLKDYVPEQEITDIVFNAQPIHSYSRAFFNWIASAFCCPEEPKTLAQKLVHHAVHTRSAKDNVTVFAIEVS
ncbi:MAG: protein serine/threonine phosphatase 2C family protein [Verrucomicrobia bacterium]|nr:protein serine/threonine phosphatase 2C family protein [Verrucomicrobiota bacterium]